MKSVSVILFLLIAPFTVIWGQETIRGYVLDKNNQPLPGANVLFPDSKTGAVSDGDGLFQIDRKSGADSILVVSHIGYQTKNISVRSFGNQIKIYLDEGSELEEVVVSGKTPGIVKSRTSLLQTETITTSELYRAACCNLSESFETNPSVDVSYSDAVTGAKQIQLLGLAGKYVQMLTENYPNFRGPASVYGLDYIPGPWMESIQISKGSASVKNGYESLTGQMNVEYKKPQKADPLSLNFFTSDAGRYEGNADAAFILNNKLSTGVFLHYSTEQMEHDENDDSFLDMPKKHQFNVMNRWAYESERHHSIFGVRFVRDYRTSGQTPGTLNDRSLTPYEITVNANRVEFFTKNAHLLNEQGQSNIALIFTGSYQEQKSRYGTNIYNVYANNLYASLMYETELSEEHRLSTGLSMNFDKFEQTVRLANPLAGQPSEEATTGAYAEYTFKTDKFVASAGLRGDYSSLFKKAFVTPRLHFKYMPAGWVNMRVSAGKGYRTVFVMPENSFYLASNRRFEIASGLKQESAWNYGANVSFYIPVNHRELTLSGEWYHTNFNNQVVADVDSDVHAVRFYNSKKSYANSIQVEASCPVFEGFNILAACRWTDAKAEYGGKMMKTPLTSDYKAMITASYETPLKKWVFDFTTQFNGGGRMPLPDATNPLWNSSFDPFTLLSAQITKNFRRWSLYAGAENIAGFTQKNPVISSENPYSGDFDATMAWGPTVGRKFYAGVRFHLER
jgi:hypothetical protein